MALLNQTIEMALNHYASSTVRAFTGDVFSYYGSIRLNLFSEFRSKIEDLVESRENDTDTLVFLLQTGGGEVEMVEKMVEIIRYHYKKVYFVVPDIAMSAGTILCMSGDKIFMDYSSALGPIDPQVPNSDNYLVPALGYLDQVERMIEKSKQGTLTDAEYGLLQNQDLATLRRYEQARDLSVTLLKDWLVNYKFKNWNKHSDGTTAVTEEEKIVRAQTIAEDLRNHNTWHSHGRMIGINTLTGKLKLKIEDYSTDDVLKFPVRQYSDLLTDCVFSRKLDHLFHSGTYKNEGDKA
jgi:membrane-bound ClpP family serine protease